MKREVNILSGRQRLAIVDKGNILLMCDTRMKDSKDRVLKFLRKHNLTVSESTKKNFPWLEEIEK